MSATQFFGLLPTFTPHSFFLFMINSTIIQSSGHTRNLVFPLHASTALPCLCHHHLLTFTSKSFDLSTMKLVCSAFSPFLQPLTGKRQAIIIFSSVQFSCSVMSDSLWPHGLQYTRLLYPSPTPRAWLESIESVMPSNHLILCHSLLLLPLISQTPGSFPISGSSQQMAKVLELQLQPSSEHSGLIYCRTDWFDLLAVQGTFESLLQHHGSKASILCTQLSLLSNSHIHTWLLEKP